MTAIMIEFVDTWRITFPDGTTTERATLEEMIAVVKEHLEERWKARRPRG